MAIELYPSSFRCDCGHDSYFFENTVREMKNMSIHKRVRLSDSEDNKHTIIFFQGKAIEIICPQRGTCTITDSQ
ncbi:hypothetical protein [Nostoc sp. UHCC 0302]|uniref:hypothetical protein n=1 Tax=Nostoc sp. UHCC 0302 TaxID=3134896 RepID=UPI00311CCA57